MAYNQSTPIRPQERKAVLYYVAQIQQLSQTADLQQNIPLNSTLKIATWLREAAGVYRNLTLEKFQEDRMWIQNGGDFIDEGTQAIPLVGTTDDIIGHYVIFWEEGDAGRLRLVLQVKLPDGSNIDLYDLIGNSKIALPEIRLYNKLIYPQ